MRDINKILSLGVFLLLLLLPLRGSVYIVNNVSVAVFLSLLLSIIWCIKILLYVEVRQPSRFHITFSIFIFYAALSSFWSVNSTSSVITLVEYFPLLVFSLIVWDIGRNLRRVLFLIKGYILGQLIVCLGVLVHFLSTSNETRTTILGQNPNILGVEIAIGIPFVLILLHYDENRVYQFNIVIYAAFLTVSAIAIFLTGSRQALIVALLSIVPYYLTLLITSKEWSKIALIFAPFTVFAVILTLVPAQTLSRMSSLFGLVTILIGQTPGEQIPLGSRIERTTLGVKLFKNNLLLGVGAGGYPNAIVEYLGYPRSTVSDNTYISILSNLGIIGFILYMHIFMSVFVRVFRSDTYQSVLVLGPVVGLLTMLLFNNHEYSIITYFVVTIIASLISVNK